MGINLYLMFQSMWRESESNIDDNILSAHILVNLFTKSALPKFRFFCKRIYCGGKMVFTVAHCSLRVPKSLGNGNGRQRRPAMWRRRRRAKRHICSLEPRFYPPPPLEPNLHPPFGFWRRAYLWFRPFLNKVRVNSSE